MKLINKKLLMFLCILLLVMYSKYFENLMKKYNLSIKFVEESIFY